LHSFGKIYGVYGKKAALFSKNGFYEIDLRKSDSLQHAKITMAADA
jgi:hypothetical protein